MKKAKDFLHGLYTGMGFLFGGGSNYIPNISKREDIDALRGDIEKIGQDWWNAIERINPDTVPTEGNGRNSRNK